MLSLSTNTIISLARAKMLEQGTEILSDAKMLIYAGLGYNDLLLRLYPNSQIKSATVTFTAGVGTLPTDFGTIYGTPHETNNTGNEFPEVSIADFVRIRSGNAVTIQEGAIKVSPNTITSLDILYWPSFANLSTTQNPLIHNFFQECLIYATMFRGYEDLQDLETSNYFRGLYNSEVELKKSILSEFEEGSQTGGAMFTEQTLISDNGGYGSPNSFF